MFKYSPNGKGMVLWNIAFPSDNRQKDALLKIQCQSKLVLCTTGITWARVKLLVVFEELDM